MRKFTAVGSKNPLWKMTVQKVRPKTRMYAIVCGKHRKNE